MPLWNNREHSIELDAMLTLASVYPPPVDRQVSMWSK